MISLSNEQASNTDEVRLVNNRKGVVYKFGILPLLLGLKLSTVVSKNIFSGSVTSEGDVTLMVM